MLSRACAGWWRAPFPRTAAALRPRVQVIVDDLLVAAPADDSDALRDLARCRYRTT